MWKKKEENKRRQGEKETKWNKLEKKNHKKEPLQKIKWKITENKKAKIEKKIMKKL